MRMHLEFFDRKENSPGSLLTKLSFDAANTNSIVTNTFGIMIQSIFTLALGLILGFCFDWRLTLINLVFAPFVLIAAFFDLKINTSENEKKEEIEYSAGEILSECVCNTKMVYAYNFQNKALEIYSEIYNKGNSNLLSRITKYGLIFGLSNFIIYINFGVIFYIGGLLIADNSLTFGNYLKSVISFNLAIFYLSMAQKYVGNVSKANHSMRNLFKIQDEHTLLDPFEKLSISQTKKIKGKIEFRNVTFKYSKRNNLVLNNLSFVIHPGQKVGFVGHSGSGKSTIVQLLERFYEIKSGQILIDDIDIKDYDIETLRNTIGLVSQEPVLFKRNVKENIRYGKLNADDQEVYQVAEKSKISHLLENNFDEDEGIPVSGGEKQRVAIARALIKDPKIMILDEATSALDKNTEADIMESLNNLSNERTCILIAHR